MNPKFFIYPLLGILPVLGMVFLVNSFNVAIWPFGLCLYLVILMAVILLERKLPWAQDWNHDREDSKLDIYYLILNFGVSHSAILIYIIFFEFRGEMFANIFTNQYPYLEYFVGLLIFDFGLYLIHRLSHGNGFLWKLHAIHHSSERIYSVNGQKRHLLHEILEGSPGFLILFVLGISPTTVALIVYTVSIHLLFQHANIAYQAGFFRHIFSVAELHRWHHQKDWKDVQGNYGAIFSFWDALSGTMLSQTHSAPTNVGLDDPAHLAKLNLLRQHQWPFK